MNPPVDHDVAPLEGLLRALLDTDGEPVAEGLPELAHGLDEATDDLLDRARRARTGPQRPSRAQLEQLLTDGCAGSYALEVDRLRIKRRVVAALADASHDEDAQAELRGLSSRYRRVSDQLEQLALALGDVRAQLERTAS